MAGAEIPLRCRVVEVRVDLGAGQQPRYRFGSGFRVCGSMILTAAHVVAGAPTGGVSVRGPDKRRIPVAAVDGCAGDPAAVDLALLKLPDDAAKLPAVPAGVIDTDAAVPRPVENCWAVGYPEFQEIATDSGPVRETAQASGVILPGSNLVSGLLSLQVTHAPRALPPQAQALGKSPWSGMSGAAVFAGDRLVGVVAEHAPRQGDASITVTPLTFISRLSPQTAGTWWRLLGIADPAALPRLPRPPDRPEPTYWATLREIRGRTPILLGRERELRQIVAFACGESNELAASGASYAWLTGEPWAGKTALLAEAIQELSAEVDCVSYFLVRRTADADREKFLTTAVRQLAWLLGEDVPEAIDVHAFRSLWTRAATRAAENGHPLLLAVDGLDEDLRPDGNSLAAWLPAESLGAFARVLVSSRTNYLVPVDVDVTHPLRAAVRYPLASSDEAGQVRALADQEIEQLLQRHDDDLAYGVLGLLAAAAGPVTVADLAELTGKPPLAVRRFLVSDAARVLETVGFTGHMRYTFAHQTLLERCQAHEFVGDTGYRQKVTGWADGWRDRGWPAAGQPDGTPLYLLDTYPSTLAGSPERRRQILADPDWIDAAVTACGIDHVLADLRVGAADPDVAGMLRMLARRTYDLRSPAGQSPGDIIRLLAVQAVQDGREELSGTYAARLRRRPPPQLIPVWTNQPAATALIREVGKHTGGVTDLVIGPDGEHAITAGADDQILRWELASPAPPVQVGRHRSRVMAIAVTPDGRAVLAGDQDGELRRWALADGATGTALGRHEGGVRAIAVTWDGRYAISGGNDGRILRWDLARPSDPVELGHPVSEVLAIAVCRDGRHVIAGGDLSRIMCWDLRAEESAVELGRQNYLRAIAVSTDDRWVITGGHEGVILRWDLTSPGASVELGAHADASYLTHGVVSDLAVTPDGRGVVSGGDDFRVVVWNLENPGWSAELGRHDFWVAAVAVTPDGQYAASADDDGTILLWDLAAARPVVSRTDNGRGWIRSLAITPDGRDIIGGSDFEILRWSVTAPDHVTAVGVHGYPVSAVAITPDGRRAVTGCQGGLLRLWDLSTPDLSADLGFHRAGITAMTITTDGQHAISADIESKLWMWDLDSPGDHVDLGNRAGSYIQALAVTRDGKYVISGDDHGWIVKRDLARDSAPTALGQHDGYVHALAVSLDGRTLISGGHAEPILIWDLTRSGQPTQLGRHEGGVNALVITPDGRYLLSGGHTGILLWDLTSGEVLGRAQTRVASLAIGHIPGEPQLRLAEGTSTGLTTWAITSPAAG